jgi:hypothetical protein
MKPVFPLNARYLLQDYKPLYQSIDAMFTMLDVGNFFLFISGFLMIHTAYKDRDVLSGYNLIGSLMLAIGISFVIVFYIQQGFWVSTFLTLPNYIYWIVVVVFLLKNRGK